MSSCYLSQALDKYLLCLSRSLAMIPSLLEQGRRYACRQWPKRPERRARGRPRSRPAQGSAKQDRFIRPRMGNWIVRRQLEHKAGVDAWTRPRSTRLAPEPQLRAQARREATLGQSVLTRLATSREQQRTTRRDVDGTPGAGSGEAHVGGPAGDGAPLADRPHEQGEHDETGHEPSERERGGGRGRPCGSETRLREDAHGA